MDFLKRELAPLVDEAWRQIENEAVRVLRSNLSGRHVVDLVGPHGFDYSAVNLGTLAPAENQSEEGVSYGIRRVLPLVEVRVPFELDIWDLDNLSRGAATFDSAPIIAAALKVAAFEERAVYKGFREAGILGISEASSHGRLEIGGNAATYADVVTQAVLTLSDQGVSGPYALVLGSEPYRRLSGDSTVYPPRQRIAKIIEGPILHSPVIDGAFLLSLRGGDFELTVGQDISIGYQSHDRHKVQLYLTESFTFRVLGPEAAIELRLSLS